MSFRKPLFRSQYTNRNPGAECLNRSPCGKKEKQNFRITNGLFLLENLKKTQNISLHSFSVIKEHTEPTTGKWEKWHSCGKN